MGALKPRLAPLNYGLNGSEAVIVSGNIKQTKVSVRPNKNKTSSAYRKSTVLVI